ncbi:MAG TPA: hypothetical protein VEZ47_12715, partial [Gemmatirosa sp.]|nr:hypothetical protein [Gemmatirosa sp.]
AQLEADVAAGAVGVGEISKSLGLSIKKADGTRLRIDDPALDPVWAACRAATRQAATRRARRVGRQRGNAGSGCGTPQSAARAGRWEAPGAR